MNTPSSDQPDAPQRPSDDRLDSWKKIAVYLKRDVTTVQRWEKREGMPVHRHLHDRMGSVFAFRSELDAWTQRRTERPSENGHEPVSDEPVQPQTLPAASATARVRRIAMACVALLTAVAVPAIVVIERTDQFWQNPIAGAVYQQITDMDGKNEAAAISRDGQFVAFLSDRGGHTDVWVTQVGSGQFHNLTRGVEGELVNPSIRTLGFSPDGSLVTFWLRTHTGSAGGDISIWAVPTLGGEPIPYLEGAAEMAWSPDGNRLVYHTPLPGDPMFVSDGRDLSRSHLIFAGSAGLHSHFPLWGPSDHLYFVKGVLPDQLDVWRVGVQGQALERITSHAARLTYPVLLDSRTLLYLASGPEDSGPWIYGMDTERRIPHRLTTGVERYTSLGASADGRRMIATVSAPERTLWRVAIDEAATSPSPPERIPISTGTGSAPRFGPDYLLYVAAAGTGESLWKTSRSAAAQLWAGDNAQLIDAPAVSPNGLVIAFSVRQGERTLLYTMDSDGARVHVVTDSLSLLGAPAWEPDGRSVTSAVNESGVPHLWRIPIDGSPPTQIVPGYAAGPTWSPDGRFILFTGPDVGTKFSIEAAAVPGGEHVLPPLTLTRGVRHLVLLPDGRTLLFLQGEIEHKELWKVDLDNGALQQLTHLPTDFDVRDFDVSRDGREAVLERTQARSGVVLIERASS